MMICRFCQAYASFWRDPSAALPGWIRSHLERCPTCRAAGVANQEFERALRCSLRAERSATAPDVQPAVMQNLCRLSLTEGVVPPNRWRLLLRFVAWPAVAGAVIVVIGLWGPRMNPSMIPGATPVTTPVAEEIEGMDFRVLRVPAVAAGESLGSWEQALRTSYETEWELAKEDGRRAVTMLVRSVVPDTTAELLLAQARTLFTPSGAPVKAPGESLSSE